MKKLLFLAIFGLNITLAFASKNWCSLEISHQGLLNQKSLGKIQKKLNEKGYQIRPQANLKFIIFLYSQPTPYTTVVHTRLYNQAKDEAMDVMGSFSSSNFRQLMSIDNDQNGRRRAVISAIEKLPVCPALILPAVCQLNEDEKYDYAQKWADTYAQLLGLQAPQNGIIGIAAKLADDDMQCPSLVVSVKSHQQLEGAVKLFQSIRQESDLMIEYEVTGGMRFN